MTETYVAVVIAFLAGVFCHRWYLQFAARRHVEWIRRAHELGSEQVMDQDLFPPQARGPTPGGLFTQRGHCTVCDTGQIDVWEPEIMPGIQCGISVCRPCLEKRAAFIHKHEKGPW